jgi:hypothetical protein
MFIGNEPLCVPASLISGVHVDITLEIKCRAMELSQSLDMLRELQAHMESRPNVIKARMRQLVELNGVIYPDAADKIESGLFTVREGTP